MALNSTASLSINNFTTPFFTHPSSQRFSRLAFRRLSSSISKRQSTCFFLTSNSLSSNCFGVRRRVNVDPIAVGLEEVVEAKLEQCKNFDIVENVVNCAAKSVVLGLVCITISFVPFRRGQVRAIAAPQAMREIRLESESAEKVERRHDYAEYTKRLLEVVSELIRVVEEVRKGNGDIVDVEKALKEVRISKQKLEDELLSNFYGEFEKLKKRKDELVKRSEEIIDEVLKEKRRQEVFMRDVDEDSQAKEQVERHEEVIRRLEEEYKEIWEKTGDVDNQMRRKEAMALSIGYRELAFIERESKQLVEAFRVELRKKNISRYLLKEMFGES